MKFDFKALTSNALFWVFVSAAGDSLIQALLTPPFNYKQTLIVAVAAGLAAVKSHLKEVPRRGD